MCYFNGLCDFYSWVPWRLFVTWKQSFVCENVKELRCLLFHIISCLRWKLKSCVIYLILSCAIIFFSEYVIALMILIVSLIMLLIAIILIILTSFKVIFSHIKGISFFFFWLRRVWVAAGGLLSCGMRTLSCGMHVGSSSLTRDQTWAPALGTRSLNRCTTTEVP